MSDTEDELINDDFDFESPAPCYYSHCNCAVITWTTPISAFTLNAVVYGLSTAIADLARRSIDVNGTNDGIGFIVYFVVIVSSMFGLHTLAYYTMGWGGGMLASPEQIKCANTDFFVNGNTEHCDEDGETKTPSRKRTTAVWATSVM
jgi:hypothetical protein